MAGARPFNFFRIQDPAMRDALKVVWDQLNLLQGLTGAPAWQGSVDASTNQLKNLADATHPTDAVTLQQLQEATNLKTIATNLQAGGSNPINVTSLVGAGNTVYMGTHATRLATAPLANSFFFETDRTVLYGCGASSSVWTYIAGSFVASLAGRPSDLGVNDTSFLFIQHDAGGDVIWSFSGTGTWYGVGTTYGALSALPTASIPIQGMFYWATDYNRMYICTGTGWIDAPGQPPRGQICLFDPKDSLTGWHACDGSTVTASTETGGTQSVTLPNFFTTTNFLTAGAAAGGGTFGAAGAANTYVTYQAFYRL